MNRDYRQFLDVPADIKQYLSVNLLNEDYWLHCIGRQEQLFLEKQTRQWLNLDLSKHETYFNIETKLEDLSTDILPIVPKFCDKQGLLFIWTLPAELAPSPICDALQFKLEPQSVKSSVADNCEALIAQVHIYDKFVFVASVKYYNYMAKLPLHERIQLCELVWKTLTEVFADKEIYAITASSLNRAHNFFNGKNIQHEPYSSKLMRRMGFRRKVNTYPELELDAVWKYEHKSCT
jgi:hypothetical protein